MNKWEILKKLKKIKKIIYTKGKGETNLLESPVIGIATIEFTSRCNIRCVYCASSQSDYRGTNIEPGILENISASLNTENVRNVNVNGHGETTIYKNWRLYCDKMLDRGLRLDITSNFAREFANDELKTLSRFNNITVSCDTADPVLFKKLRRGADIHTLCLNIMRIMEMALQENRQPPSFSFNCVVSDQNALSLLDFAMFAKELGIRHINFCSMKKYPDLVGCLNPVHITEMPAALLPDVKASFERSLDFLKKAHIGYRFQLGILDALEQEIQKINAAPEQNNVNTITPVAVKIDAQEKPGKSEPSAAVSCSREIDQPLFFPTAGEAKTRDCLDPWNFLMIQANKYVLPCCWYRPIHSLGMKQSLAEVFNSTLMREIRRRLLTGDLAPDCRMCGAVGWTTTTNLKEKVWNYLHPGIINKLSSFRGIPALKPDILSPYEIVYEMGWFHPEINLEIAEPVWQRWQWTTARALRRFKNPGKESLFIMRGSVDKSIYDDQKITLKINDYILDDFIPPDSKFYKEFIIKKETLGKNSEIDIMVETDKTFVPAALQRGNNDNRELGVQVHRLFFGELGNGK